MITKPPSPFVNALPATPAIVILLVAAVFGIGESSEKKSPRLVVHEWGTFTVLQDAGGKPVAGVNINEEALPDFVHRLAADLIPEASQLSPALGGRGYGTYEVRPPRSKGIARGFQLAIMRMETPIIYFYPPGGKRMTLDVSVGFRSGWLTEWFPQAENESPGYPAEFGGDHKPGTLIWRDLEVGVETEIPPSGEHVWLAPREVDSAKVRMPGKGQAEQYLFYRGVAQLQSPIRVQSMHDLASVALFSNLDPEISVGETVKYLWLADVRPDGKAAFRPIWPVTLSGKTDEILLVIDANFSESDYSPENLAALRQSMRVALIDKGLFEDEAEAMLNTWEFSYFKSPGLRLFYILPDAWTNHQLPLEISEPADVTRVMIGRVELISQKQEELLAKIAAGPVSDPKWLKAALEALPDKHRLLAEADLRSGKKTLAELEGVEIPSDYRAYIELGRFREAILMNRAPKDPMLQTFANRYGISLR